MKIPMITSPTSAGRLRISRLSASRQIPRDTRAGARAGTRAVAVAIRSTGSAG